MTKRSNALRSLIAYAAPVKLVCTSTREGNGSTHGLSLCEFSRIQRKVRYSVHAFESRNAAADALQISWQGRR
jgi:hypothetical protein